jgi:ribosome-associated protein
LKTDTIEKVKKPSALTLSSKLMKTIIAAIHEKKGSHVLSMDLKKIPEAVADYFIMCDASNHIQIKAIADNIEARVKEFCGESVYKMEGKSGDSWILVDYIDVVVHCMTDENRRFYKIEELWQDAKSKEHNED